MPIYEYRCQRCGHQLEVMQKVSDPAPDRCPKCEQPGPLERLMSRTSFQLKGGGWYADLYGSAKKGDSSSSSGPAPSGTTSSTPAPASSGGSTSSTSAPAPAAPAAPAKPSGGSSGSST